MTVSLVAAMSLNRVIGRAGAIPWRISGEQKIFRRLTVGRALILGRKTYESIGRALPERLNVVVTRQPDFAAPGVRVAHSLEAALDIAREQRLDAAIGGGAEIYAQAMPLATEIHLTIVQAEFEGDAFFPEIPEDRFRLVHSEAIEASIPYVFSTYERIPRT
jgi:dihydrofolate reductase